MDTEYDIPTALAACEEILRAPDGCEAWIDHLAWNGSFIPPEHPALRWMCLRSEQVCSRTAPELLPSICELCGSCESTQDTNRYQATLPDYIMPKSPKTRLESAVEAGDFRFLGVIGGIGGWLVAPCHPDRPPQIEDVEDVNVIDYPYDAGSFERNEYMWEYSAEYNLLLLKYLSENPQ